MSFNYILTKIKKIKPMLVWLQKEKKKIFMLFQWQDKVKTILLKGDLASYTYEKSKKYS